LKVFVESVIERIGEGFVPLVGQSAALTGGHANGGLVKVEFFICPVVRTEGILHFPCQGLMTSLVRQLCSLLGIQRFRFAFTRPMVLPW